ncbi:a7546100-e757-412f-aab1-e7167a3e0a01 [Thermothielavioides terrestris]|uniref:Glycoside hydrolase family 18 protein n=2 Tax=Thermothielavioides terrestris TaxID=2587410 RepID=G2QSX4_THETT|nr:glycoside hydrolase family 18 protein [Thermothielavioides terrestris NRRL 8126]AEO62699.1 glycoside hydrolase family 18 protein [Thermothielavioides terrestris NRRL 8126]SPQ21809.1 a7546100-e757-412f-aab1-e7167a3e0a01 [Thermothielavioides terrestris]
MPPLPRPALPRLITYYQTHHTPSGSPISVLPLLQQPGIALTHLILAAIHINEDPAALTLNDHPPSDPRFTTLWAELRVLQASGIQVLGMLGGAAPGTFARLDAADEATFERYYGPLARLVRERGLDGLDLDVEEPMSLAGIVRLIDRLRADFGPAFVITLAPVAAALLRADHNLSGFDYEALEVLRGAEIAWYNAQFYCGWGDCSNPAMYEMLLAKGWKPEKIVVGLVTNPKNGSGWVPWNLLGNVLPLLAGRHPRFGGVMGWEYFNSLPGGEQRPWEWAQAMTALLRGRRTTASYAPEVVDGLKPAETALSEADPDEAGKGVAAPVPQDFEYYSDGGGQSD